jgi:hypothetical protein
MSVNDVSDVTWAADLPRMSDRLKGYSIYVGPKQQPNATFNANLAGALEGRRIAWGRHSATGGLIFMFVLDPEQRAWQVTHRQTSASPLRKLGIQPKTRVWFQFDDKEAAFVEVKRIHPWSRDVEYAPEGEVSA